jgi:hypothetical protein
VAAISSTLVMVAAVAIVIAEGIEVRRRTTPESVA